MKMIRTVYNFNGVDYSENQLVAFQFDVQTVSIQNFIEMCRKHGRPTFKIEKEVKGGFQNSQVIGGHRIYFQPIPASKMVTVKCWSQTLANICMELGKREWQEVLEPFSIRHNSLRKPKKAYLADNWNQFSRFIPEQKKFEFKSGAPEKMQAGEIRVIGGCLWKRYF